MRLKDVIRADKTVTSWGKWQEGAKLPRSAFPLSKSKNRTYRLPSYRWRVIEFEVGGQPFRLLVAYRVDKEQYRAVLAVDYGRDMSVLAQYEFHGPHPGWHVHASCEHIEEAPRGTMRHPWQRRIPRARARCRRIEFGISNDNQALNKAAEFFRLHKREGELGL